VFLCAFLFTRIFPTLIISNAGLGTRKKSNDNKNRLTFFVFQENLPKTSRFHFAGMQKLRTFEPETLKRHSKQLK